MPGLIAPGMGAYTRHRFAFLRASAASSSHGQPRGAYKPEYDAAAAAYRAQGKDLPKSAKRKIRKAAAEERLAVASQHLPASVETSTS